MDAAIARTELLEVLDEELDALRAVLDVLTRERAALDARDADSLLTASNLKAEAIARAARLEQRRKEILEHHPEAGDTAVQDRFQELRQLAATCRERNDANGVLIRGQRRRIEGSLQLLQGGRAATDVYGRDGEKRTLRGGRGPLVSV